MYQLIRPLLFLLETERAHALTLQLLHYWPKIFFPQPLTKPVDALGLIFPHPIGLAAGLDKNGDHLDALAKLGFAFLEIGTVTPRPQIGNPKPRLFRLPQTQALINRMGFNNLGVDYLVNNVKKSQYQGILGINIGKNKDTSLNKAVEDYCYCLMQVYPYASYVTVNISSPNTPELRALQQGDYFKNLLNELREEQLHLADRHQRYVPLVIKISPDEADDTLKTMAEVMLDIGVDGIIATNTTVAREPGITDPHGQEQGGLSGSPLKNRAMHCLQVMRQIVGHRITLIASGGIDSPAEANSRFQAGASLLQVYTGLIYQGPALISTLAACASM